MDTTHELDPAPLEAVRRAAGASGTAEAALLLAAAGVPVFPCVQGSARPLLPSGPRTASSDLDHVVSWWSRYPTTNLAVPTGAASGFDVLEVRTDRNRAGISAVRLAAHAGLVPRPGLAISTANGGLHLVFSRQAHSDQPSWDAPRSGLRFHGEGGYILLPPSLVLRADGVVTLAQLVGPGNATTGPVDAGAVRRLVDPAASTPDAHLALPASTTARSGPDRARTDHTRASSSAGAPPMLRPASDGADRRPSEVVSL